jgi:hypothetical protein
MELITLDSSFQPKRLIENYSSLIWAERYSTYGDFELQTGDVSKMLSALPLESCVSLRDSTVPMVVEAHKIVVSKEGIPNLTVVGRSFESVTERRVAANVSMYGTGTRAPWLMSAAKPSDAAYKVMRLILGDSAQYQGLDKVLEFNLPAGSLFDTIPEIELVMPADFEPISGVDFGTPPYPYVSPAAVQYNIELKDLYAVVTDLIKANHHGIKAVRPVSAADTQVRIEIYNGADLTNDVQFDARFDQFDEARYLLSYMGSSNVAYVYGPNDSDQVNKTSGPEPTGLNRRVIPVDSSGDALATNLDVRKSRGLVELYKNNATALFDGQISVQIAQGYNRDYFLGDILTLVGEYGLTETVRVSEFIRSADANGEKAYPAFEVVS